MNCRGPVAFMMAVLIGSAQAALSAQEGYLGVELAGNRVRTVRRFTPAERSGLMEGDQLLTIDGLSVSRMGTNQIMALIAKLKPGSSVAICLRRKDADVQVHETLIEPVPPDSVPAGLSAENYYMLGIKQRDVGFPNAARRSLQKVVALKPGSAIAEEAKRYIQNQLPMYDVPAEALSMNNAACGLADDDARIIWEHCVKKWPKFEWPFNNLAALYIRQKRYDEAKGLVDRVLSFNPNCVNAWIRRSSIQKHDGNWGGAQQSAEKALSLDPDSQSAREMLVFIKGVRRLKK